MEDDISERFSETEGVFRTVEVEKDPNNEDFELGMNLTRSRWDPYPWVAFVLEDGPADRCGIKSGDVLLNVNNTDLVGLKISSIAAILKSVSGPSVTLSLWTNAKHTDCDPESLCCGPLPYGLTATKAALTSILTALECPVCSGTWSSSASGITGVQCARGHLLCGQCRRALNTCPMCRSPFFDTKDPRSKNIFAETVYSSIVEAFRLDSTSDDIERHTCLNKRIFGSIPRRPRIPLIRIEGVSSCQNLPAAIHDSHDNIAVNRCRHCLENKSSKKKVHNKLLERLLNVSSNMSWRAKSVGDLTNTSGIEDSLQRSVSASHVDDPNDSRVCQCGRVIGGSTQSSTNGIAGSCTSLPLSVSAGETAATIN